MKWLSLVFGIGTAFVATASSAQPVNLTGVYKCVQMCRGNLPAHITQNGPELNVLTEAGQPSKAWPDAFWPANRIWVESLDQGAVYSPDGMLVQFDGGTIWRRYLGPAARLRPR
jgi:hypothetical protein